MSLEEFRQPFESDEHWALRKEFLERYKDEFDEDRLLCLAQVYTNMELLQCSYPEEVEQEVRELSLNLTLSRELKDGKDKNTIHFVKGDESPPPNKKMLFPRQMFVQSSQRTNENEESVLSRIPSENSEIELGETQNRPSDTEVAFSEFHDDENLDDSINFISDNVSGEDVKVDLKAQAYLQNMTNYMKENFIGKTAYQKCLNLTTGRLKLAPIKYNFKVSGQSADSVSCTMRIKKVIVSEAVGPNKSQAQSQAAEQAFKLFMDNPYVRVILNNSGEMCLKPSDVPVVSKEELSDAQPRKKRKNKNQDGGPANKKQKNDTKQPKQSQIIAKTLPAQSITRTQPLHNVTKVLPVPPVMMQNINQVSCRSQKVVKSLVPDNFELPEGAKITHIVNSPEQLSLYVWYDDPSFVLYDNTETNRSDQSGNMLQESASFSHVSFHISYETLTEVSGISHRCDVIVNNILACQAIAKTKQEAKRAACDVLLDFFRTRCYTIKVKNLLKKKSEGYLVSREKLMTDTGIKDFALTDDNVGCKMMKMMGWSGGGIGRGQSGIIEPIKADISHGRGKGLGFSNKSGNRGLNTHAQELLEQYISSSSLTDLIFTTEFNSEERKKIHKKAEMLGLKSQSRGPKSARQLVVSRKYTMKDLFKILIQSGSNEKYSLIPPRI